MKYFLLNILLLIAGSAMAEFDTPSFFNEDFASSSSEGYLPSGWITYGIDAAPSQEASQFFGTGTDSFRILTLSDMKIAMANTEFENEAEADQWLVTPEIEVPYDNAALLFTACAFANKGDGMGIGMNNFKVLLSEGGDEKADFSQTLIETGIRGSATVEVTTKKLVVPVNDMKGKKVRIAFVVTGSNVGFTGFADLRMGQYIMSAENFTREVASLGSKIDIDVNIGLKTPVECGYVDATLYINDIEVATKEYKKTFGSPTSFIMQMQRIVFENAVELTDDTPVSYILMLTPRFEGALPSVVTGTVATPGATYPANVVIEEMTATGCGWCPRGTASLEYYLDKYAPATGKGRAIAIAVHGYMNYYDPMNAGVEEYIEAAQALNGSDGLPGALFNRATRGLDPTNVQEAAKQMAMTSYNKAAISAVTVSESAEGERQLNVGFKIRNGYNTTDRPLNASIVMIENDVKGNEQGYSQTNYFYNATEENFLALWDAVLLPYIKPFLSDGELGQERIPFGKMTYQHVARGIFPDFNGAPTASEWKSDVDQEFNISFAVPSNVINFDNTEVILLVTNPADGSIVASDIMEAADYSLSAVESVEAAGNLNLRKVVGGLAITAHSTRSVRIFSADGTLLVSTHVAEGETFIPLNTKGLVIIDATDADGQTFSNKIIL